MYTLTLSKAERKAINFAGYRYWHGDDFEHLLMWCDSDMDADAGRAWDDDCDITFDIQEHDAWEIADNLSFPLELFSDEFAAKLQKFVDDIV